MGRSEQTLEVEHGLCIRIQGRRRSLFHVVGCRFCSVLTLGFSLLLSRWVPDIECFLYTFPSSLADSTHLFVVNNYHKKCLVKLNAVDFGANDQQLMYFEYQLMRFIYDQERDLFVLGKTWPGYDWALYDQVCLGIQDVKTLARRRILFGKNEIALQRKSRMDLFVEELFRPFNVFQMISIFLWCLDDYLLYAGTIFLISLVSISSAVRDSKMNHDRVLDLSKNSSRVNVYRFNQWYEDLSNEDLVVGDVVEIPLTCRPSVIPCDLVLLHGEVLVNESTLTGESVPVSKTPISKIRWNAMYRESDHSAFRKSTLYCGTKLVRVRSRNQAKVLGLVINTGVNTTKGELIRNILFNRPINFRFYKDSMKFVAGLSFLALGGFLSTVISFVKNQVSTGVILLRAADLVTVAVPPALPASLSIGTNFAVERLLERDIFCIDPPRINVASRLDCICFDKTGTLTEEGLDIYGIHVVQGSNLGDVVYDLESFQGPCSLYMALGMATCHSLKEVDGKLVGDPLDIKMFEFARWRLKDENQSSGEYVSVVDTNDGSEFGILKCFEFESRLRRMSVIVGDSRSRRAFVFSKGSPEEISQLCNASTLPQNMPQLLKEYTIKGYRVIAVAFALFQGNWEEAQQVKRDYAEQDLWFLGLIVFENKLKPQSAPTIRELKRCGIQVIMCTGDDILTAISISRQCNLIDAAAEVYLSHTLEDEIVYFESMNDPHKRIIPSMIGVNTKMVISCTGSILDILFSRYSSEVASRVLKRCLVYGRMWPEQKGRLVEHLQKLGSCVGFCGDGANDCNALKKADVGISLSDAEASVAAPFTCKNPNIECIVDLMIQGRSSIATSFSTFKFMALYSFIQFTSVTLLYYRTLNFSNSQFVFIDMALILPVAICIGRLRSRDTLSTVAPASMLVSKQVLGSVLGQASVHMAFQIAVYRYISRTCTEKLGSTTPGLFRPAHLNTSVFLFSAFQYIVVAYLFCFNRPYQKSLLTNKPFVVVTTLVSLILLGLLLIPWSAAYSIMGLVELPREARLTLCTMVVLNAVCSGVVEILFSRKILVRDEILSALGSKSMI